MPTSFLLMQGLEAKVASSLASLASWRMSFQCRLEQVEGDTRVRWQGVQETVGGLQRGLEQTREGLRTVEREGGEQMAVLNTGLKKLCSRMDAAESWQQRVVSSSVCAHFLCSQLMSSSRTHPLLSCGVVWCVVVWCNATSDVAGWGHLM